MTATAARRLRLESLAANSRTGTVPRTSPDAAAPDRHLGLAAYTPAVVPTGSRGRRGGGYYKSDSCGVSGPLSTGAGAAASVGEVPRADKSNLTIVRNSSTARS